jgi:hypothetical protein
MTTAWIKTAGALVLAGFTMASAAQAQQGTGPVATACKDAAAKFCADIPHGQGRVRSCLEANKDKVAATCQEALATHGPAKGTGQGQGQGQGKQ